MDSRSLKIVVPVLFFAVWLGVPVSPGLRAQPPLRPFAGQQISYQWTVAVDARDFFPGQDAQMSISATIVYVVQRTLIDGYEASVSVDGTILWPASSIDRQVNRTTTEYYGAAEFTVSEEVLGAVNTFELSYVAYVHSTGAVETFVGSYTIGAICRFTGTYFFGVQFVLDTPGQRGVFFFDDINAGVGDIVGTWGTYYGTVLAHTTLATAVGDRPAIHVETQSSYESPTYNSTIRAMYHYDRDTGFLLRINAFEANEAFVDTLHGIVNRTISGEITATNMYLPRFEQVLPWLLVIIIPCTVLVLAVLVYRRYLRSK